VMVYNTERVRALRFNGEKGLVFTPPKGDWTVHEFLCVHLHTSPHLRIRGLVWFVAPSPGTRPVTGSGPRVRGLAVRDQTEAEKKEQEMAECVLVVPPLWWEIHGC